MRYYDGYALSDVVNSGSKRRTVFEILIGTFPMLSRSRWQALLCLAVCAGCSDPTAPLANRAWIVFVGETFDASGAPSSPAIWKIHPDGTGLQLVTKGQGIAYHPRWSRDRRRIAFVSDANTFNDIWTMTMDGGQTAPATNPDECFYGYARISWSPAGDRILADCGRFEQFVINLADRSRYSVTAQWGNVAAIPDWSPVDDRILYLRGPDFYVANLDGSAPKLVASNALEATWSHDGKRIAFGRQNENQSECIWIVNADGTGERQITFPANREVSDMNPAWSPDDKALVLVRAEGGNPLGLQIISVGGGEAKRITPVSIAAVDPDW